MDQDERETGAAGAAGAGATPAGGPASGATRSQSVVHTLPHDWNVIGQFLRPALERVNARTGQTQLLVLTADAETAVAVARAALFGAESPASAAGGRVLGDDARVVDSDLGRDDDEVEDDEEGEDLDDEEGESDEALGEAMEEGEEVDILAVTSAKRATRQLRARSTGSGSLPVAVAGTPAEIAALIRGSVLKLDALKSLVVAWADEVLAAASPDDLEAVMAEVPKDAARVVVTSAPSEAVDEFVERYMRRARRVGDAPAGAEATPVSLQYVSVGASSRSQALRRLLDELDPPSAAIVARAPESQDEALEALHTLGYREEDEGVVVTDGDVEENTSLVVLYDLPRTRAELDTALAANPVQVIALVQPRQLAHLRALAAGGRVVAHTLPEAGQKARRREEKVRAELRAALAGGAATRELVTLEPLLEDFDGVELAAAALKLLERERERSAQLLAGTHTGVTPRGTGAAAGTAAASAFPAAGAPQWKRIFMTVGEMDGASKSDVAGAVMNEGGIEKDKVGKIEMRDSHTLVEVAADDAERVAAKLNGTTIRGRHVVARLDQERAAREGGAPPKRGGAGGGRGGFDRGERGGERGDRGERGGRFERGPRSGGFGGGGGGFNRGGGGGGGGRGGFDRGGPPRERTGGFDRDRGGPPRGGGGGYDRSGPPRERSGGYDRGGPPRGGGAGGGAGRFERGPRRDEAIERGPRAAREGQEWAQRGDQLRNARRGPRTRDDREGQE